MGKRGPAPGMGGRPPKPLAEKVLDGNPGKRKLMVVAFPNAAEFQGEECRSQAPCCPPFNATARHYKRRDGAHHMGMAE